MAEDSKDKQRALLTASSKIWILSSCLTMVTVAVWIGREIETTSEAWLPWWGIAIAYALVEVLVVHIHLRQDAYSFSMAEVPLILGLIAASPSHLLIGQVIGTTAALVLHRHQPPLKVGFNVANFALCTTVAIVLYDIVPGTGDPYHPGGWVAVYLAAMGASVVNTSLIAVVLRVAEGRVDLAKLTQINLFGILVAATNTSLGLALVLALRTEPAAVFLFGVVAATLLVAYRAYAAERRHHESLEFIYSSTRALTERRELGQAVTTLLENTCAAFRSSIAELVLLAPVEPSGEVRAARTRIRTGDEPLVMEPISGTTDPEVWALLRRSKEPELLLRVDADADTVGRDYLDSLGVESAMVTTLQGEDRTVGLLVVGGRLTDVTPFARSDLRLFETVANHAAVSLENDQLETSVTKLLELEAQLSHQAFHDAATGLPNRRQFTRYLTEVVVDQRMGTAALLFIDLDDFKAVNDTMGHQAGDEVLRVTARRLESCVRSDDVVARLGGDEFAVLLRPGSDADATAERIVVAIREPVPIGLGQEARVGCSIGVAMAADAASGDDLIRNADTAMYAAKTGGKGRLHRFTEDLYADVLDKRQLQREIERGIENDEFEVHYQPILHVASRTVVGAEALLRWRSPEQGLIPAGRFIEFAEETGQSVRLGQMVVQQAVEDAVSLRASCGENLWVTINVSGRQLAQTDVAGEVRRALHTSGLPPAGLVVEITETAVMADIEGNLDRLRTLQALGVRLALDDFGTGHSSLSHLRTLPIDILKVAKEFLDGVQDGVETDTFLRVIVQLGHTLGLTVVAEGVEDEGQADFIVGLGCELGQGWLWSPAVTVDQFAATYGAEARVASAVPASP